MKDGFKFRVKLLVAMMLVVSTVTTATLYIAEKNLHEKHRELLNARFQHEIRSFLALQKIRLATLNEKCKALSHSVRLRAALEERDVDDLYRNALTELRDLLALNRAEADLSQEAIHASFVRFIDADGEVLPSGDQPVGLVSQTSLTTALESPRAGLSNASEQDSGFIALTSDHRLSALHQIIITKIIDWNGADLGALVLGFPMADPQLGDEALTELRAGIFYRRALYISGVPPSDRAIITHRINAGFAASSTSNFEVELEDGPHLIFYKRLDPETKFEPAYEVCLFPLAQSLHEAQALRWKILTLGAIVLCSGFAVSLLLARGLAKPVDKIVAGSVENFARRQQAEENLEATNRELAKALDELRKTQRQVIQQERLRAIGQMASGIAHDFNNTLTPILGFSELLLNDSQLLQSRPQARPFLEMLHTSARDAAKVVSRLREFYRPVEVDAAFPAVDLAKIAQQAISLTEPKWKNQAQAQGITIEVTGVFHARPTVAGEEAALREMLTNLIFNAVDAMPKGGRITVEVSVAEANALLCVRDTGLGMTEEVRERCFEPFFSTKGERGTGLGLSMVYGIVERHRGRLDIKSAPGKGTAFFIRLPLSEKTEISTAPDEVSTTRKTQLSILVVDDDERVCEVVAAYLRSDGHSVVVATGGLDALTKVERERFDVVFLDRAMPRMSGDQAAKRIKQLHPHLPIIMLTGFGALIEVTGERPQAIDAVLGKPVTLGSLRQTIDKLLYAA